MFRTLNNLCCLILLFALGSTVFAAGNPQAPNLSLYVTQRIFPPSKPATVSLTTFNLKQVELAVYTTNIETVIPNAAVLNTPNDRRNPNSVSGRIAAMELSVPRRAWSVTVKDFYQNNWRQQEVKLPALPSGVYIIEARGGGVTVRTWFAISTRALLVKRSPDVVKAWLVNAQNGQPVAGASLALYDVNGRLQTVRTAPDGIATFTAGKGYQPFWVAAREGEPAFARASIPEREKPYQVFMYSDRPIYRPGQLVRFRGTVRAVQRGAYLLPKEKSVHVQIKTRGDTVVYDEHLSLTAFGSFAGDFQLAPEPPLGSYTIEVALSSEFREYYGFQVQAYRKPEFDVTVTTPKPYYLGSEVVPMTISAQYFFGSPVAGAKVKYAVHFNAASGAVPERILTAAGLGSAASGRIEEGFTGQGKLDKDGKLVLAIPTRSLPYDREVSVEAEVTDLSLRSRSGAADTLVTAALYRLSLATNKDQYQPGETVTVTARALDYSNKPVQAPIAITLIEHMVDREKRPYEVRTKRTVTTNKDGLGVVTYKVVRPGYFNVESWGRDAQGNAVFAETQFNVCKEKPAPDWPMLELSLDKEHYAPGEVALLRVRPSLVGSSALLTVEGERLYRFEMLTMPSKDFTIKVPVMREYQPGVMVHLSVINRGRQVRQSVNLLVPATEKKLTIKLTPNKNIYQPGETATYDVATQDAGGHGVPAELGLGVVDAAIYAIQPDNTPNPFDIFWQPQARRVETDFSLEATYPGGGYQHIAQLPASKSPAPPEPDKPAVRVRKMFVDTAFWSPSLITDQNGTGQITFTVPDNLTTWRATARGLTRETQAGEARTDVKVTLPLLVRLTVPRFYVRNDEGTVAAIVHNYTGAARQTRVTLSAEGATIAGEPEQTILLPADGIQRLTWKVKITGMTGGASDQVRLLVSADGGEGVSDAVENTLPVFPDGVKRVDAVAGMSNDGATIELLLPADVVPGSAGIDVAVSPSLAGPIFEALDYLVGYPHGCAEQTMSRFLPDIIVTRTLRELGAKRPAPPMLNRYVSFGLQKLLRYQHSDGGWHWWEFDQSDPYMTAYVVYGLALARDAGYPLAAGSLPRGVDYLRRALENEHDRTAAAYLLLALAYANRWDKPTLQAAVETAQRLIVERGKLDTFSRASLALALDRLRRQQQVPASFATAEQTLVNELETSTVQSGTATHWTANAQGGGSWLDSDVEVTAQVLQALLAVKPESAKIVPAVRWLMAARQGKAWNSTKDTTSAVLALTAYLQHAKELAPDETVTVRIGEKTVRTLKLTQEQAFADPTHVTISAADLLPGANTVRLEKAGAGNLYWSAHLSYVIPAEGLAPQDKGIHLTRHYRVVAEDPVTAGVQSAGSLIEVTVDIDSAQSYRYAMLQEPVPAGCEIVSGDFDAQRDMFGCDHVEQWDDRLVYYFDYLPKGEQTSVTYWLRAEAPGAYRIRPGVAELMYFPEVRGEERLVRMKIEE